MALLCARPLTLSLFYEKPLLVKPVFLTGTFSFAGVPAFAAAASIAWQLIGPFFYPSFPHHWRCPCGLFDGSVPAALISQRAFAQEGNELAGTNHGRFTA